MKKALIKSLLVLVTLLISQTGLSTETDSTCEAKSHNRVKHLCYRYPLVSFGGTLGYYKIDMEQVQTVAWGQAETANTVYFKNGQSLQFTNYDAYNGFQRFLYFLERYPEFIK